MTRYPAPAPPFVQARHHGGRQTPRMIVMHSTVGPTGKGSARNIARYFASTSTVASAHYVVDAAETYQCVGDHTVAYHCGYNQDSIGVEMCDYPTTASKARWNDANHKAMMQRTARLVAQLCLAYNINPYFVGVRGLKRGRRGITTHDAMSRAFRRSTHWDPGAWPRFRFMRAVRREMRRIKGGK